MKTLKGLQALNYAIEHNLIHPVGDPKNWMNSEPELRRFASKKDRSDPGARIHSEDIGRVSVKEMYIILPE